jgi:hypothetical protein
LLLAAGQGRRHALGEAVEPDELEHRGDLGIDLRPRTAAHLEGKGDIVGDRQMREQGVALEHHADVALVGGHREERGPLQQDVAR